MTQSVLQREHKAVDREQPKIRYQVEAHGTLGMHAVQIEVVLFHRRSDLPAVRGPPTVPVG